MPRYRSYEYLAFPHDVSEKSMEVVKSHRHMKFWQMKGRRWAQRWLGEYTPPEDTTGTSPNGTCQVQVVRSSSRWSHGIETEHSIQNACTSSASMFSSYCSKVLTSTRLRHRNDSAGQALHLYRFVILYLS